MIPSYQKYLSKFFKFSNPQSKYKHIHQKSFPPSPPRSPDAHAETLAFVPTTCSLKCLSELHALLIVTGAVRDTSVIVEIIDKYLSHDRPALALSVFGSSHRCRPTVYSLNLAVRCFSDYAFHQELLDLYRQSCVHGSDKFTFPLVIKACAAISCPRLGKEVHCAVLRSGHGGNVGVQTALLDMYAKTGRIELSRRVFDGMSQRDLISWNAMISGYSLNRRSREAVEALHELQEDGLRPEASTLVAVVGTCSGLRERDVGKSLHAFALKCGALGDESLVPTLSSMYAGIDDLSSARLIFDLHRMKDSVSYNAMISAYAQHGKWKEAFEVLKLMHCAGVRPNLVTLVSVLPSCSDFFGTLHGESMHAVIVKFGLADQVSVVAALVSMYATLGELDSAVCLFRGAPRKSHLLWNSMISGYLKNQDWNMASDTFCRMQVEGFALDEVTMVSMVSGCRSRKDLHAGKSIHAYAVRNGFNSNLNLMNSLLAFYADCDQLSASLHLFRIMKLRNLISWNTIISGFAEIEDTEASLCLFHEMHQEGTRFDLVTLISLVSSFSRAQDVAVGASVHSLAVRSGCDSDISLTNALITMYTNCGNVEAGRWLFDCLSTRSTVSHNAVMTGYRKNNLSEEIMPIFHQMLKDGQRPNSATFLNLVPICQSQLEGKSIHGYALRNFLALEPALLTASMCMYTRFDNIDYCHKLFHLVRKRNIVLWNAMMSACVQCKQAEAAFSYFQQMRLTDVKPDAITMLALISACSLVGSTDLAQCLTALVMREGMDGTISVINSLIDMHSRCGSISFATELFHRSMYKDSITWSAMINAYGMHGEGETALDLFLAMKEAGVHPDDVTFVSILSACSHAGLVDEGRALFKSMQIDHGITPRVEHYGCMVDLFGRTGHLDEAYELVRSMPLKRPESMLESLLGACRSHGNAEIGKAVGELLIKSEHGNPRSHVMLSNIYAATGKWNEYERVRCAMEDRGLTKDVGVSLIELIDRQQRL